MMAESNEGPLHFDEQKASEEQRRVDMDAIRQGEAALKRDFGEDFKEPSKDFPLRPNLTDSYAPTQAEQDSDWDEWARTIDFKVTKQGQIIIGLTVGTLVALGLGFLNGKVVLKLVQSHGLLVTAVNGLIDGTSPGATSVSGSKVSYSTSTKVVDTPPIDEELVADLTLKMDNSTRADLPEDIM